MSMAKYNSPKPSTSTSTICHKCGVNRPFRDTIPCNKCKNRYEFDCIGLSEKLYHLMSNDKKLKWKCPTCALKQNKSKTTNSEQSNITLRKKASQAPKKASKSSFKPSTPCLSPAALVHDSENYIDSHILTPDEKSDESYSVSDRLSKSAEHTQLNDAITEYELREENKLLKINLISTESELENKILENNDLQKCITRLNKELDLLKNLCKLPNMPCQEENKRHSLQPSVFCTPLKAPISEKKAKNTVDLTFLQIRITDLKQSLLKAQLEIDDLNKQIFMLKQKIEENSNLGQCNDPQIKNHAIRDCMYGKTDKRHVIHIIGDEQLKGLSTAMLRSRTGKWNDKYLTSATIFTGASSSEMLRCCENISKTLSQDDIVILGFGSHDNNLNRLHSNLCIAVNMLSKSTTYIVPVLHSPYFNEYKLYQAMTSWIKHFENCSVIDLNDSIFFNDSGLTNIICKKINSHIDYNGYKNQFLTFKNSRNLIKHNVKKDNKPTKYFDQKRPELPKKGTIPFYFTVANRPESRNVKSLSSSHLDPTKNDNDGNMLFRVL